MGEALTIQQNMETEQKKEIVGAVAGKVAAGAADKAKTATGWAKWLWGIGAAIAAAIAWFCGADGHVVQTQPLPTLETTE